MRGERRQRDDGTLAEAPGQGERRPPERRGGLRAAGIAGARIAGPIVARHGGGVLGRLKAEWSAVAGADFAAASWPEALGRDGALKLRVEPGLALELQHRAPLLIGRINGFFGRPAVSRLILVQATRPGTVRASAPARPQPLGTAAANALDARLGDIADPELRASLERLGRLVLGNDENR
jgi:hypothetical protein